MFEINHRRPMRRRIPAKPTTNSERSENPANKVVHTYMTGSVAHILWGVRGYA
ncbi:MAG: hypothetical protein K0R26_597 [Bacteroidota bacterium]|jgi:hypothetical protein|nr:hypothetical protein [Bacteroidota bacterium]